MPTRSSRRRRVDPDDRRAVAALAKQLAVRTPAARLGKVLADQAAAALPRRSTLGSAAVRKAAQFKRDGEVLLNRISREVQLINASWTPWKSAFDNPPPPRGDLLHVFVPDERGTQGPFVYRLQWRFDQDPAQGVKSGADVRTGKMWVEPYTIDKQLSSYAALGVRVSPIVSGSLRIRPFVNWVGFDALSHVVYDPQLGEQRWATAMGHLGINVQSTNLTGGNRRVHVQPWTQLWRRSELNPAGSFDYGGTAGASTGLHIDVPASKNRRYEIWIVCRGTVDADKGFAVATHAGCGLSCHMPFLVVEELPIGA